MTVDVIKGLDQIAPKVIPITNEQIQKMFAITVISLAIPNMSAENC